MTGMQKVSLVDDQMKASLANTGEFSGTGIALQLLRPTAIHSRIGLLEGRTNGLDNLDSDNGRIRRCDDASLPRLPGSLRESPQGTRLAHRLPYQNVSLIPLRRFSSDVHEETAFRVESAQSYLAPADRIDGHRCDYRYISLEKYSTRIKDGRLFGAFVCHGTAASANDQAALSN